MESIANRLKQALSIREMSQSDLARKSEMARSSISQYISGKFIPKQDAIYKLAKALNVDEGWLMGYDIPMIRVPDGIRRFYILDDEDQAKVSEYIALLLGQAKYRDGKQGIVG